MCITKNVFHARGGGEGGGGTYQPTGIILSDLLRTTSTGEAHGNYVTSIRPLRNSSTCTSTEEAAGKTVENAVGAHTPKHFCDRKTATAQSSALLVPVLQHVQVPTPVPVPISSRTAKEIGTAIEGGICGSDGRTFPAQAAVTTRDDTPLGVFPSRWNDGNPNNNNDKSSLLPNPFLQTQTHEYQQTQQQPTKDDEEGEASADLSFVGVEQVSKDAVGAIDRDGGLPENKQRRRKKAQQPPGKTAKLQDRHFVRHSYHDHATEHAAWLSSMAERGGGGGGNPAANAHGATPSLPRKNRGGVSMSFPYKVHEMLEGRGIVRDRSDGDCEASSSGNEEEVEWEDLLRVVSWQPHGRAFKIHDPRTFAERVMPRYFRQSKLTSFQRQLNLYGFLRLSRRGPDEGAYYHELFLRGMPLLCARMVRTKCKGTGFKASSSPDSEPDFYSMPPVPVPALLVPPLPTPPGMSSVAAPNKRSGDDGRKAAEEKNLKGCNKWAVGVIPVARPPSYLPPRRRDAPNVTTNQPPQAVTPRAINTGLSRLSSLSASSSLMHYPSPCEFVPAGTARQLPRPPPGLVTIPGPIVRQVSLSQQSIQVHHRNWRPPRAEAVVTASEDEGDGDAAMDERLCHADPLLALPIEPPQPQPTPSSSPSGAAGHARRRGMTTWDPLDEFITAYCSSFPSSSAAVGDFDVDFDFVMEAGVESDEQLGCLLDEVAREVDLDVEY